MPATADRLEFAPPPQPGLVRAFVLAVLAHLLLMLALTWGINWNRESDTVAAEAELWSSVPQEAAPRLVEAPPPPPAPPAPPPPPPPEPPAPRVAPTPPPPPAPSEADIALEREKIKQEQALRKQEELERQKQLEARKKREELEREKKLEARKKEEELKRQQVAEQKAAEEKKRKKAEELAKAKAKQDEAKVAVLRKENLDRMMRGLQGATGSPTATGTAPRSAGPSDSYAGKIRARVRPNIVFTDDISGNPTAEVEVRVAPDGTITSRRLVKSSGIRSWDEAVLRALDKTEILPRDVDGRVHSPLFIEFRPKS